MRVFILAVAVMAASFSVQAAEVPEAVKQRLQKIIKAEPDSVVPAAMPGMYVVSYGPRVFYLSADGRYVFRGDLIDLEAGANLTEARRKTARVTTLEHFEASMIEFAPEKYQHTLTVFTDVSCGYCKKLHSEMADINALGMRVRYLAYPRAGLRSRAYKDMVSVWCAKDQRAALTAAKSGAPVAEAQCENPVAEHYQLGQMLGVRGTPTIVLESGDILPGYAPPEELLKLVQESSRR